MKYVLTVLSIILIAGLVDIFGQSSKKIEGIYAPEGLNMPGAYDSWANPPSKNALAGATKTGGLFLPETGLATPRYKTVINVQSGGDATAGTYQWKFTSGPSSNYWSNQWAKVNVVTDSIQLYTFGHDYDNLTNNSVTLSNGYYTVIFHDNGYASDSAIWMYTTSAPRAITSVTGIPASVSTNTPVTLSVTFDGALSSQELAYVRYSTDNFATSSAVQVTGISGSGSSYTGSAVIPGQSTNGTTVSFYVLTTTVPYTKWYQHNIDLLTMNYSKNSGANYSYNVAPITSIADGNWSSGATWNTGSIPPAGANITIGSNVTLDTNVTISALTINSGKTFTASGATPKTLTIANTGTITNNGTFANGNGTIAFAGTGTVTGTVGFYNVTIANGVNFGTASTINGTLSILAGGYINTNPPAYASGSTLKYTTNYSRYLEWSATSGAGYPANVQISNNSLLDLGNGGVAVARQISGSLTIDNGSTLSTNVTGNEMTAALTVAGNVNVNGSLLLSATAGGDLNIGGNLTVNGTFTGNGRSVQFNGAAAQTIGGTGAIAIDNLNVNTASGLSLTQDVTVNNQLQLNSGLLTLGAKNLTLGASATVAGTPSGTAMVVQNSTGLLRKQFSASASFTFPVGTVSGSAVYSPVNVNFASGAVFGSGAYLTAAVTAGKYANNTSATNYLNRYWTLTPSNITSFQATVTGTYAVADVAGTEASLFGGNYANSAWTALNKVNTTSHQVSGTITAFGTLTAGEGAAMNVTSYTSVQDGNWSNPATWDVNSVPSLGATVTINNAVTLNTANVSINSLTIAAGKSFNLNGDTLTIAGGGSLTNNGTLTSALGTVVFSGAGTVTGNCTFYNLNIGGGLALGTADSVLGTFRINAGGYLSSNAINYGNASTLNYYTGSTYGRGTEWSATTGAGYPFNVKISNATTLDLGANSGAAIARQIAGSLTVDAGSALTMNAVANPMSASLTINGSVTNNGTITLSGSFGGDLAIKGDITNNGTFTPNSRAVQVNGAAVQTIGGTSPLSLDYFTVNNTAGVALAQSVTINNQIDLTNGVLTIGSNNLSLAAGAIVNGTPSSARMIVATGTGQVRKYFSAQGSFTFPVGNAGASAAYTPVRVALAGGTYAANAYVAVNLTTSKHPQNTSAANYLKRYWSVASANISGYTDTVTAYYVTGDVAGTESGITGGEYTNLSWTPFSTVNTSTHSFSGSSSSFGDFTGGEAASMNTVPYVSVASGSWKNPATWNINALPPSGARVTIANDVTLDTNATVSVLTINSGKTLTASDGNARVLTVVAGDSLIVNGTLSAGNGTIAFAGNGTVTGTVTLNNVTIAGGVNFGTAATVSGILSINSGGYINTNPPYYGSGATLKYNTGGTYGRYLEWSDTTGRGYPYHVQISSGSKLDLGNGGVGVSRRIAGNLTIDALSTLTADSTGNQMTAPLTVLGSVVNNGRLILSSAGAGPDLHVGGTFTNNGYFTTNGRELVFDGSGAQSFSSGASASTVVDYLAVGSSGGLSLNTLTGSVLTVNQRVRFLSGSGNLSTGADTLWLGSAGTVSGEDVNHAIVGVVKTTKAVGTALNTFGGIGVTMNAGAIDAGNVTVTRLSGAVGAVTYAGNTGINRSWRIASSVADTVNRTIIFSWLSTEDNGKDLTKTMLFQSVNAGASWSGLGNSYLNTSASHTDSAAVTRLGWFSISDSLHPLALQNCAVQVTALSEGLWNGTISVRDTFTVELRAATTPFAVVVSGKALATTAGVLSLNVTGISGYASYYVVVKGRNTIETWSAAPVAVSAGTLTYDFTTAATQAYGNNETLKGGKYCLYAGDVDQNGAVDSDDLRLIDNDVVIYKTLTTVGQTATDLDGNKFVDSDDLLICDNNVYNYVMVSRPAGAVSLPGNKPAVDRKAETLRGKQSGRKSGENAK